MVQDAIVAGRGHGRARPLDDQVVDDVQVTAQVGVVRVGGQRQRRVDARRDRDGVER